MKYIIIQSDRIEGLGQAVNDYISQGWQPQGGVATSTLTLGGEPYTMYAQAMTLAATPQPT